VVGKTLGHYEILEPLGVSAGRKSCPDFLELDSGDFVLIDEDVTNWFTELRERMGN